MVSQCQSEIPGVLIAAQGRRQGAFSVVMHWGWGGGGSPLTPPSFHNDQSTTPVPYVTIDQAYPWGAK